MKGLGGAVNIPTSVVMADSEHLVKQAKELQYEEERLRSDFPAAAKVMEPDDENRSTGNEDIAENGREVKAAVFL